MTIGNGGETDAGGVEPHKGQDELDTSVCTLAITLAARMRENRDDLTRRWLDRISARVSISPNKVFPTDELLNHVPLLIDGIASYIEDPGKVVLADVPVVAKAMELGELRFTQGFDEYELLKEYEIFGGILFSFLSRIVDEINEPCSRGELLACAHRLFLAIALIQQATITHYLTLLKERVGEREQRLRGFNRALTHELKNLIGTISGAAELLQMDQMESAQRVRMATIVIRNAQQMRATLDNLLELSRIASDSRQTRHVALPEAVNEVVRQLRETARSRGIEVRIAPDIPAIEVNAAALELCLSNYIANAIKYSDPSKPDRWVEIFAEKRTEEDDERIVVEVRDNGLGVPEEKRARLFERFFRAHDDVHTSIEGTGLGLSIVRDTIAALGGSTWAEFNENGSVFAFSIPARREREGEPAP